MKAKKATRKNPVVRKEYLIQKFEESNFTEKELDEFLSIPFEDFTIEEIARTQRIDPDVYKQLMKLNPADGRYVYYNIRKSEYYQDDIYNDNELGDDERIIDLHSDDGIVSISLGGFIE